MNKLDLIMCIISFVFSVLGTIYDANARILWICCAIWSMRAVVDIFQTKLLKDTIDDLQKMLDSKKSE